MSPVKSNPRKARSAAFLKAKKVFFVGIGGIGISAIARMALSQGKAVSGSDLNRSEVTNQLEKLGARISFGQKITDISKDADLIVYSEAIPVADKSFFAEMKKKSILSMSYPEALSEISKEKFTIAVSGTHGKTTTSAMIAKIFTDAGLDPTVIVGSILLENNSNFIPGKSEYLIVEADEYRGAFLNLSPKILVVNNIDEDHLDYFKDLSGIQKTFAELAKKVPKEGAIVTNFNHPNVEPVIQAARAPLFDCGSADISGLDLKFPGEHNRQNARAAITVAGLIGIGREGAVLSLNNFKGTWRRFEYKGKTKKGALVYDDYAHNPPKIRSAIQGAREKYPKEKIVVVFQPHLFSRTKLLFQDFARSFAGADEVIVLPIYPAREKDPGGINSGMLVSGIQKNRERAYFVKTFEEAAKKSSELVGLGGIIVTMGAGETNKVADLLIQKF